MDAATLTIPPRVIPRSDHSISRANISPNAVKVLYRLRGAGFRACLVGGGVRDLLLGLRPKDFDIATDAHPEDVHKLFRNCRLIGRRFRLAHVHFGREIIEVATFRATHIVGVDGEDEGDSGPELDEHGRIISDNAYGTIDDDAVRRDFTINALYYDIEDFSVLDYANGMADLKARKIRLIGDPELRYREDPVRMLRAVRFAAKLGFDIEPASAEPIKRLGDLLDSIPPARLFDEVLKLFLTGHAVASYHKLMEYGLIEHLIPATADCLETGKYPAAERLILRALENTDARLRADKPVTPYFLYGALLWPVLVREMGGVIDEETDYERLENAAEAVVISQIRHTALPKRYSQPMRETWLLQPRFHQIKGRKPLKLLSHPRFRAAYDFFVLRTETGDGDPGLAHWWTRFQAADESNRESLLPESDGTKTRRRRKPRRRRNPTAGGEV